MKNFLIRLKVVPVIVLVVAVVTILFSAFEGSIYPILSGRTLYSLMNEEKIKEKAKKTEETTPVDNLIEVTVVPVGDGEVDINNASLEELDSLPGVGEIKSKDIVSQREKMNGFTTLEDIMCTEGIGEGILEKILPYIKISLPGNSQK